MNTETWLIEARDPLIVRDGRPFDNTPGSRAASLAFPYPATTAGGVRTRAGIGFSGGWRDNDNALSQSVRQIGVRGPLLAEVQSGEALRFLVPAPADAVILNTDPPNTKSADRLQLVPLTIPSDAATNLPENLNLIGSKVHNPNKAHSSAPRFWYWEKFAEWMVNPSTSDEPLTLTELGHNGPTGEQRTHVRIDHESKSNDDGGLFQTRGLEFVRVDRDGHSQIRHRLAVALSVTTPDKFDDKVAAGLAPLGGERRVVGWRRSAAGLPECPIDVRNAIKKHKACRLVLLTPAFFEGGFEPTWLSQVNNGITAELKAIAVSRAQVISGWDFLLKKPKVTRRLTPGGSVLFLKLGGGDDEVKVDEWITKTWMQCVSDDPQDRLDGFGLAAFGVWDGSYHEVR
jgi:CRISPR-associated protein Cmr3